VKVVHLLGQSPYAPVLALQEALVAGRRDGSVADDVVLLLEHQETITLGRKRGAEGNVLAAGDVPVISISRGGDATWHGPGQLVAYPIVALEGPAQDLHAHLHHLEDAVVELLAGMGIESGTDPRNTGVWLDDPDGERRKVCSIGIACRKWVTFHGLALNVDVDLGGFAKINPCGFGAEIMTTLVGRTDRTVHDLAKALAGPLVRHLSGTWDNEVIELSLQTEEQVKPALARIAGT